MRRPRPRALAPAGLGYGREARCQRPVPPEPRRTPVNFLPGPGEPDPPADFADRRARRIKGEPERWAPA